MQIPNRNDLTQGSLARGLIRLSAPMFASAVLHNVHVMIDLFWVGRLGSDAVAALALSTTVLMLLYPVIMGVTIGTVAIVARAMGGHDRDGAARAAGQSLFVALLFGLGTGLLGWSLSGPLCDLLAGPTGISGLSADYLRIAFAGGFATFVLLVGNSILQGAGNTVLPMFALLFSNLVNILLDPVLIFGLGGMPRLGVKGAALATVIAQTLAAGGVLFVLHRGASGLHIRPAHWRIHPALAARILRIAAPSTTQLLARSLMQLVIMRIVASCGTAAVAAFGIAIRFHMMLLWPAFSLGAAAATTVGQNLGARRPQRAVRAAWLAYGMNGLIMALAGTVICLFAPAAMRFFDKSPDVVRIGVNYLRTVTPAYLFSGLAIVLGRAISGAGKTFPTMVCTITSLWGVQVPLALVLARTVEPATQGIWWAVAIASIVNGLLVAAYFVTGRWLEGEAPSSLAQAPLPEPA